MLNRLQKAVKGKEIIALLKNQNGGASVKLYHISPAIVTVENCNCRRIKSNNGFNQPFRIHSSLSDSRRQKVVLETATPKIVLEKLPLVKEGSFRIKLEEYKDAVDPYVKLMRLDKPIGTWLLFWPCSWSVTLASMSVGAPVSEMLFNLALFFGGSVVMRGAGCTINDLWDKDIDRRVERTKDRPLASGAVTQRQAIMFLGAQLSVGLAILMQLNWYSVILGASSMLLVVTYPLAKRITNYPQLVLGATFNWGALLGWSAVTGALDPAVCLPLYASAICWTVVYDTIYAHQDKLDDARIGIKSTALTFGRHTKPALTAAGVAALAGMATVGVNLGLGWPYYASLAAATAHIARQIYTLNPDNPSDCAYKFKSNSLVGFIVFLGMLAGGWKYSKSNNNTENITEYNTEKKNMGKNIGMTEM